MYLKYIGLKNNVIKFLAQISDSRKSFLWSLLQKSVLFLNLALGKMK